jgi:hypothetical protein
MKYIPFERTIKHQNVHMNIVFSTLNINTYNCIIVANYFYYAMNLCNVFYNANFLLPIPIGAK